MSASSKQVSYNIYPSALDAFEGYINSDAIWEQYWGGSEDPKKSQEEFESEQFQGLIDKLNRVPFDSEPADKGTAFNEVVDALILNKPLSNPKCTFCKSDQEKGVVNITYNNRQFEFSLALCREFAQYYQGAVPQMFVEGHIDTKFGRVHLYGYADEVMADGKCCDIKTTSMYKAGKFRNNTQHLLYPFCLKQMGIDCNEFEYNVTNFKETFTEHYLYDQKSEQALLERVERFINFIEDHRHLITDKKLFNELC